MALLPNTYIYGTTGNNSSPTEKIGGVAIGITDATNTTVGNPLTVGKTNKDMALPIVINKPILKTNPTGVYNATRAISGGTFAYNQVDWMVMKLATTINGTASSVLTFAANAVNARRSLRLKAWGARTSSAFRANRLRWTGPNGGSLGSRVPWASALSGLATDFVSTTNNSVAADDQAIYVTFMSVPGELVYMEGGKNPLQDEYAAQTN